jgi:hypothetical protein
VTRLKQTKGLCCHAIAMLHKISAIEAGGALHMI